MANPRKKIDQSYEIDNNWVRLIFPVNETGKAL